MDIYRLEDWHTYIDKDCYAFGKWVVPDTSPKILSKKFYVMYNKDMSIPCSHITFCYLTINQGIAKGVSITSNKDKHSPSRGRQIALGRAEKAIKKQYNGDLIKKPEYYKLRRWGIDCLYSWIST